MPFAFPETMKASHPPLALPIVILFIGFILSGCGGSTDDSTGNGLFQVRVQLDWVAEPEHGAFYTAEALGYFLEEGLDVTLVQGGPNSLSINKVATGQADLGQADSTNVILAIEGGAPVINVASVFQNDPSVLMMQKDCPVEDWEGLQGMTVMVRPEWAFIPYLKKKYDIEFDIVPQNFELGRLMTDKTFVQQGFYIAEPFFVKQQGIDLKFLYAWDTGFDAYTTLFANKAFAYSHPEELKAFIRALKRGYRYYIEVDPQPAHDIMLEINSKASPEFLDFSRAMIIDAHLHKTDDSDYLTISRERYQTQLEQLMDLKIIEDGSLEVEQVMTDRYSP